MCHTDTIGANKSKQAYGRWDHANAGKQHLSKLERAGSPAEYLNDEADDHDLGNDGLLERAGALVHGARLGLREKPTNQQNSKSTSNQ